MTPVETAERQSVKLPRVLGPVEAFCVVVGSVIGSGIFLVPATVAYNVPFMSGIVLVWVIGGIFIAAGALTLAELGAMLPQAGGLYVFLRAAYGALPAFLFGWVEFLVVRSGSMATLAAAFARYFSQLARPPAGDLRQGLAGGRRGAGHCRGDRGQRPGHAAGRQAPGRGDGPQGRRDRGDDGVALCARRRRDRELDAGLAQAMGGSIFSGQMVAMVGVLWAYDGWTNVTPLAEEIRDPGRNIPLALLFGTAVLIAVYLGMTLAYHYVLPMKEIRSASRESAQFEKAAAAVYCEHLLGSPGVVAISILVMCSTFISLNGNALTGPRRLFRHGPRRVVPGRTLPGPSRPSRPRPMPSSPRGSGPSS